MLFDLPDELLLLIAHHLQAHDLITLTETSRRCNSIAITSKLWFDLVDTNDDFDPRVDYMNEYAWRHGRLTADEPDEETFLHFQECAKPRHQFCHRTSLCASELPMNSDVPSSLDENIVVLAQCHGISIIHLRRDDLVDGHHLVVLRQGHPPIELTGLKECPLVARIIGSHHVVVCGRFPALLFYDLDEARPPPVGVPLSSHAVYCMSLHKATRAQKFVIGGHYKGRGSMEIIAYNFRPDGTVQMKVEDRNKFAGIAAIVSCVYLPSGSIISCNHHHHIYLWSSIHQIVRRIDQHAKLDSFQLHTFPRMSYHGRKLLLLDRTRSQCRAVLKPGKTQPERSLRKDDENSGDKIESEQVRNMLTKQSNDMDYFTRRILGM